MSDLSKKQCLPCRGGVLPLKGPEFRVCHFFSPLGRCSAIAARRAFPGQRAELRAYGTRSMLATRCGRFRRRA